jgi:hypothetical protein
MLRDPLRAASLLLVAASAAACGGASSPPPPEGPPDATYSVNAEIVRLPGALGGDLELRHESIPEFRDRGGRRSTMMSMTMPFGVAPDVDLSAFVPGDRVRATFEVRWSADNPLRVTTLVPLPEDTRLEFDPDEILEELPAADDGS